MVDLIRRVPAETQLTLWWTTIVITIPWIVFTHHMSEQSVIRVQRPTIQISHHGRNVPFSKPLLDRIDPSSDTQYCTIEIFFIMDGSLAAFV